ncbi:MAG TPA: KpsF/GutQ family sugar-phosphate isomerase [Syntrophorhabdaceae bacterium]
MSTPLKTGKEVLRKEAEAILRIMEGLDDTFDKAVDIIDACSGRLVVMGVGKSGLVCRKIASTFSSVGTPSLFLHPGDSLHGDLGMLQKGDVLFIVSNSGETEEVIKILPWIKRMDFTTIVVTGNPLSTIAKFGDAVFDVKVDEACPYNTVPTSSTTVALALGDALAVAVMEKKKFNLEDFASLHPGGTLGRKLLLKVEDLMHKGEALPRVHQDRAMKEVIIEITTKRLGVAGILDDEGDLVGVITDGDLRRAIEKHDNLLVRKASEVMSRNPKGIVKDSLAAYALKMMEEFSITSLFVVEAEGKKRPVGVIHIHDLLKAKIV